MGIRFLRLAYTSAGAINTTLMTVIGEKKDGKSIHILEVLCNLDFFCLVDRPPTVRRIIKKIISHHNFATRLKWLVRAIVLTGFTLFLINFILLGFQRWHPVLSEYAFFSFIVSAVYFLLLGGIIIYLYRVLKRLKKTGYGINPDYFFYNWIQQQLQANGVNTVSDLNKKASYLPKLKLRAVNPQDASTLFVDVTFITSELVTQNKIQFPEMSFLSRLPSFGINLDDSKPDDQKNNASEWSITGYLGRIFNTIRFYYDKDFLLKNRMYEKGIG